MDYTDLTSVKNAMDSLESAKDAILSDYITRASRTLDKLATSQSNVADYFKRETITDEILTNGVIDYAGRFTAYPHKPVIWSVSAMSYRYSLRDAWTTVDLTLLSIEQESVMFEGDLTYNERIYTKISYDGGLAATESALPNDLINIATVEAVRLYKEARAGMSDIVGVVELGTLSYTKAFPSQVIEMLNTGGYARMASWT